MIGYSPVAYTPLATAAEVGDSIDVEAIGGALSFLGHPVEIEAYTNKIEVPAHDYALTFRAPFPIDLASVVDPLHFMPVNIWPGYAFDGVNITLPIAELPGLSVDEADTVTGDWRDVFQSILLSLSDYMAWDKDDPIHVWARPSTIGVALLEDWNRPTVNEMRRSIRVKFNIQYAIQKITEEPT